MAKVIIFLSVIVGRVIIGMEGYFMKYVVTLNGKKYEVEVEKVDGQYGGKPRQTKLTTETNAKSLPASKANSFAPSGSSTIKAPMPGTILDVKVTEGASVNAGDVLFILEAMKMENEIVAEVSGTVFNLNIAKGDKVGNGDVLFVIKQ
jgi:biotin carboxyl carrier protein